ncbi:MAG TPA: DUF423 domain-containing protein [Burkholderiales bacterium]|nr:DUF423 domain-containing protein [Burkholderiales bacterium]
MKAFLVLGALLLAAAVALGAFGAHALRARLDPTALAVWSTAVQYHFWHALGVLAVALAGFHIRSAWLGVSGWLLVAGVVIFSGSLYALAMGAPRALGMAAPLGGTALVAGWLCLAVGALRG